jgi:MOSC domain-containing protein
MTTAGAVTELWRFPVKSMQGERLPDGTLTDRGFPGDRAYAIIDTATGRVASAKSVKTFPGLLACRATFLETPKPNREMPPVRIDLPDGKSVTSDSPDAHRALSAYFRREVILGRAAPDDYTIDMYHPDIEGAVPESRRDKVFPQKLGSALFAELGMPSPVPAGAFFDVFPLSVITTSTLRRLHELRPTSRFEPRRFRMNVIVRTDEPGFVENHWIGRRLGLGADARVTVAMPDSRCVMTTLAQDDLPQDADVLRTLVQHNMRQVGNHPPSPCAGVYAVIAAPGAVRTGDPVTVS